VLVQDSQGREGDSLSKLSKAARRFRWFRGRDSCRFSVSLAVVVAVAAVSDSQRTRAAVQAVEVVVRIITSGFRFSYSPIFGTFRSLQ
jgi:hypothetical protein